MALRTFPPRANLHIRSRALFLVAPLALVMCSSSPPKDVSSGGPLHAGSDSGTVGAGGADAGPGEGAGANDGDVGPEGSTGSAGGDANGGVDGGTGIPADCPASDVGNTPLGTDTPDPTGTAVNAITYTNVGATGSYDKVVSSTMAPSCVANT